MSLEDFISFSIRGKDEKRKKYKIRKTDEFSKAINRYTESMNQQNKNTNIYNLYFDGAIVDGTNTPLQLGLEDEDILDAKEIEMPNTYVEKIPSNSSTSFTVAQNDTSGKITVQVRFKNKYNKKFLIRKADKMQVLFDAVKNKMGEDKESQSIDLPLDLSSIKFKFDGLVLNPNTTAMEQDMEDMDIIDVD